MGKKGNVGSEQASPRPPLEIPFQDHIELVVWNVLVVSKAELITYNKQFLLSRQKK
jgi:hypothetical protein